MGTPGRKGFNLSQCQRLNQIENKEVVMKIYSEVISILFIILGLAACYIKMKGGI
jgi:hypothetical protein